MEVNLNLRNACILSCKFQQLWSQVQARDMRTKSGGSYGNHSSSTSDIENTVSGANLRMTNEMRSLRDRKCFQSSEMDPGLLLRLLELEERIRRRGQLRIHQMESPRSASMQLSSFSRKPEWRTQQAHRQHQHGPDKSQNAVNCESEDAEWQNEQPDKWIGDQRQYRDWPAEDEQNAPEKESGHNIAPASDTTKRALMFPGYCKLGHIQAKMPSLGGSHA